MIEATVEVLDDPENDPALRLAFERWLDYNREHSMKPALSPAKLPGLRPNEVD